MVRFFAGLVTGIFFFTKIDILIWQRIFEANKLWELGIGTYHHGWTFALYGFMVLGFILFYPHARRMVMFPLSLVLVAFSGLEDVLYYWLDGRAIPTELPWLYNNPLILQPVTNIRLVLSAAIWITVIVLLEVLGSRLDQKIRWQDAVKNLRGKMGLSGEAPAMTSKLELEQETAIQPPMADPYMFHPEI